MRRLAIANRHPRLRLDRRALRQVIAVLDTHAARFRGGCPPGELSVALLTDLALADSLEAASRSLKQVTRESLGELIDTIYRERIADGQLDDAPLTFAELAQSKKSFIFTMLNMLHSRVAYPPAGEGKTEGLKG